VNSFDETGASVSQAQDRCSKQLGTGCKKRFVGVPLPFGGFPGAGQFGTS